MSLRTMLLVVMLFACSLSRANSQDPKVLRKKIIQSIQSRNTTDSLYNVLNKINKKTPLIVAYIGTLDALKAKHAWNPYSKIKYLNVSEKRLQTAVADEPHNIEIRFMRFSIQHNVPSFLGFGKNLVEDRHEIIKQIDVKNYGSADRDLTIGIIKFLIDSKRCTPLENADLSKQLAAL
jgi:hypothetical protein